MKKQTVELTETEWLVIRLALLTRAEQLRLNEVKPLVASKYREIEDKIDIQTGEQATNQQ